MLIWPRWKDERLLAAMTVLMIVGVTRWAIAQASRSSHPCMVG